MNYMICELYLKGYFFLKKRIKKLIRLLYKFSVCSKIVHDRFIPY